jgi:hypothetical protein
MWNLWTHNMNLDGAAPFLMAQAAFGAPTGCELSAPTLIAATPGHTQVTLEWSVVAGATGYKVYYDQVGKAQLVADVGNSLTHVDSGLTDGMEYCYKVTAYDTGCESDFSNIMCATPTNQGQGGDAVGVSDMETGIYTGKGKNQTFSPQTVFTVGEDVTVRARVLDEGGLPVANATVEIQIGGPETASLNSNPSDADGWAEAQWQTKAPNRKGNGGTTPGQYTATTTNVTASGYNWDSVQTSTEFTVQ